MAYNKKTWLARLGQGLNKFIFNGGSKVTLDSAPDVVSQQGTPLSADNMNDLEQRIKSGFDDVDSAINAISDVIGNLGWNQLVDNFHYTSLVAGVNNISGHPISYKQGHKYLICQKGMTAGYFQSDSAFPVGIAGSDTGGGWHGAIGTAPSNANSTPFVSSPSAQTGDFYFNIFDLTAIFGAGNEPSTVDEFHRLFPTDYYPYTEGYATKEDVSAVIKSKTISITTSANSWVSPFTHQGVVSWETLSSYGITASNFICGRTSGFDAPSIVASYSTGIALICNWETTQDVTIWYKGN